MNEDAFVPQKAPFSLVHSRSCAPGLILDPDLETPCFAVGVAGRIACGCVRITGTHDDERGTGSVSVYGAAIVCIVSSTISNSGSKGLETEIRKI
jgi:hypothetical protein